MALDLYRRTGAGDNGDPFVSTPDYQWIADDTAGYFVKDGNGFVNNWNPTAATIAKGVTDQIASLDVYNNTPTWTGIATVDTSTPYRGVKSPPNHGFGIRLTTTLPPAFTVMVAMNVYSNPTTTTGGLFNMVLGGPYRYLYQDIGVTSDTLITSSYGTTSLRATITTSAMPNTRNAGEQNVLQIMGFSSDPTQNIMRRIGNNGIDDRVNTVQVWNPMTSNSGHLLYPEVGTTTTNTITAWPYASFNGWAGSGLGNWIGVNQLMAFNFPGARSRGNVLPANTSTGVGAILYEFRVYRRALTTLELVAAYEDMKASVQSRPV